MTKDNTEPIIKPIEIKQPKKGIIAVRSSNDVETALSQLININEENIVHEPTCLICANPHRKELEEKWFQAGGNKKHSDIHDILTSKSNVKVSDGIIDNHMTYHANGTVKELQKIEYLDKIKRISNIDLTTLDRIGLAFSVLTERLSSINSLTADGETSNVEVEKIKTSETVKLMNSLNQFLKLQATLLGELKNTGELIMLPRDPFINIFNQTIALANTQEEKRLIGKLMNDLISLGKIAQ